LKGKPKEVPVLAPLAASLYTRFAV